MRKNHSKIVCIKLVHLPYLLFWEFKNVYKYKIQLHTNHSCTSNTHSSVTVENQTVRDLRSDRLQVPI